MRTLLSMSCCSCRGWRNLAVDQGMQMEEVQAIHWDADDGQARAAGAHRRCGGTTSNGLRSLSGGGVKLLSNPSQRFVAAFIGHGLPPSPKQFRVELEIEFPRARARAPRRLGAAFAPPHTPKLTCMSASRRPSVLTAFWPPTP
jgi:hypothetical protein